jgi:hypothetical protein
VELKKNVLVIVFALAASFCFAGLELHVAPLAVLDDSSGPAPGTPDPGEDLVRSLSETASGSAFVVRAVESPPASPIRSYLDAARLCQARGYTYLLYGYLKRNELSLTAEVKLLDAEKGAIAASFFNSDDSNHYPRLIKDLAARIEDYFSADIGLNPPARKRDPQRNLLSVPVSLGYWTPAGGEWSPVLAGLGSLSIGARFIPARPLFTFLARPWFVALGIQAEYALGLNQPGYESFLLHEARLRIPIELDAEISTGHVLAFSAGPLLVVDTMVQDRLYAASNTSVTTVGGLALGACYRYTISESISVGCAVVVDVAMYANPLVTVSPRIDVELTPHRASKERGNE